MSLLNRLFTKKSANGGVSTIDDPTIGTVILNHSARAKRVSITVKPSGEVRLTMPLHINVKMANEFLQSRREWIIEARQRVAKRVAQRPSAANYSADQIAEMKRRAKEYLPSRVEALATHYGLSYNKITIRTTRSKWGSCNARCDLSLNTFLMMLPHHLIDFVILHELAHTVHHNHSAQFHGLLNTLTQGREKELHQELKNYRIY